ncbi:TetR/AcrR family transcriptional regulator [Paraburkholderia sp. FT54]|uniref:TetR/AcrR family transcriptional regulator n=1 Tax=Paraburkholderia sp. FT54 TaxID=3074437 RepID=UPI0028779066|nr:TetR/AcrR family transcriptional regulator [Paraburkholderia sp. FT54]WNC88345.1 TetR/AcrR family transcriptional regulator [Paraburkholderia sp. FT54]
MGIAERKNRQKQALRERILDAARRIVMREGFAALSMRKIADAIEYSPATLYLHFASRDEIAQALCAEGYAQLLETFVPLADIADPAERLKALGRAYVAFGVAHPQTYRLIFMEDPSYTGAALGGAAKNQAAHEEAGITASEATSGDAVEPEDDPGAAALHIMISALEELKAAGHLSASTDVAVWAEAFWATLHGIVALNLTCPVFPSAPLDTVVGLALDAWLGVSHSTQSQSSATAGGTREKKSPGAGTASPAESGHEPAAQPSSKKSAKAASRITGPAPRRKAASA